MVDNLKTYMHENESIEARQAFFSNNEINLSLWNDLIVLYKEVNLKYQNCLSVEKTRLVKTMINEPDRFEACQYLLDTEHTTTPTITIKDSVATKGEG